MSRSQAVMICSQMCNWVRLCGLNKCIANSRCSSEANSGPLSLFPYCCFCCRRKRDSSGLYFLLPESSELTELLNPIKLLLSFLAEELRVSHHRNPNLGRGPGASSQIRNLNGRIYGNQNSACTACALQLAARSANALFPRSEKIRPAALLLCHHRFRSRNFGS